MLGRKSQFSRFASTVRDESRARYCARRAARVAFATVKASPNSTLVWRGPSRLTGSPIVLLLSGLREPSGNRKTGHMLQAWIVAARVDPAAAVRSGTDRAVCGDCLHRHHLQAKPVALVAAAGRLARCGPGGAAQAAQAGEDVGRCYVEPWQAPASVWRAWRAGRTGTGLRDVPHDVPLRIGAYGDPAAVPARVWRELLQHCRAGHTGYTHQWHRRALTGGAWWREHIMASVDSVPQAKLAVAMGWRYFRTAPTADPAAGELHCPAVSRGAQCARCKLCSGAAGPAARAPSIVIAAH